MADFVVSGLADRLLTCFCAALAANPNPPRYCAMRGGEEVAQDLGARFGDECCEGLGYVKVASIFPSTDFPVQDETSYECIRAWAVTFELGVFRCAPGQVGKLVSGMAWKETAQQLMDDAQSMRQAICCMIAGLPPGTGQLPGAWVPLGPQGGCIGGTMEFTVQVALNACVC